MPVDDALIAVELVYQFEYDRCVRHHDIGNIFTISTLMFLHIAIFDLSSSIFHDVDSKSCVAEGLLDFRVVLLRVFNFDSRESILLSEAGINSLKV